MVTISPEVNEMVKFVADKIDTSGFFDGPDEWGKTPVVNVELADNGFYITMESGTSINIESYGGCIFYTARVPDLRTNSSGQLDIFQRDKIRELFNRIVDQLLLE